MTDRVEINVDAIPDELKERDQWLLWDKSNDTPRRPHWAGDFTISWSDPDAWHSFSDALAQATKHDSWGIGYVTAADNDDHARGLYGVIDIDGAAGPDGPRDWVPSLAPFFKRDAYIEWSPSGNGLHIPVAGIDLPDWWRDVQLDDADHQGVDALTNKFCTFSGDTEDGAGEAVVDGGEWLDDWLADAYQNITGDDPRAQQSLSESTDEDAPDEEWLDVEAAEEALSHIDPDASYDRWRNIGFALASHFPDHRARMLFEQWSRRGSKYDDDAERLIKSIVEDSDPHGGVGIGTLVQAAKENGWDPSAAARERLSAGGTATADGGAQSDSAGSDSTQPPTASAGGEEGAADDAEGWERVHQFYVDADDADERLPARYEAACLLDGQGHWRNVVESDRLWRYDAEAGLYRDDGENIVRETLVDGLREQFKAHEQREICEQLRGRHTVTKDRMGGPDGAVLTENCVIEIDRDGFETRDPTPDDEFMGRVETPYDPETDCPRWEAFLKEVLPNGSDRKKVQEFAGYMLHHWGLPHHKALFLVGPTASGKSTLLDTLRAMLGSDSVASLTPQQMAGERFGGAELRGAWANIRNDIPANTIQNVGQLKEIIGGDPIKAEKKHEDPFMFEPTAKHAFSANQLPDAEVNDEAFFRRILLVPVPDTVPRGERDPQLDDKLQDELPGILNWALKGLNRLLKQGQFTADRTPAETQRTWERWGHSIDRFKEDCLDESQGNAIPKSDLYSAYVAFCEDEGIPKDTQHKMTRALKQAGLDDGREYVDGSRERCIIGIDWTGRGEQYRPDGSGESEMSGLGDHR